MDIHVLIRNLRVKQGLSQKEVASGIMSPSAYSKFESGERAFTSKELDRILTKLDAHLKDLSSIELLKDPTNSKLRALTQAVQKDTLDLNELKNLHTRLKAQKDYSIKSYRNYLYVKHHFKNYTNSVDPITTQEINQLFNQIKEKKYLTYYHLQLVSDFTPHFTAEQLLFFWKILRIYRVESMSALDHAYLQFFLMALSNITDTLIDKAVIDHDAPDLELLAYAEECCDKLSDILTIYPSFNFSLLFSLFRIRLAYYKAVEIEEKMVALNKAQLYKKEIEFLVNMRDYDGKKIKTNAEIVLYSLTNLLETGMPGKVTYFID
ncbi:helix-turn-helix domain-containing protein [Enterococcus hirae]|nr:helix-turn-helix domain-containing protein [Enterococcus hirae]